MIDGGDFLPVCVCVCVCVCGLATGTAVGHMSL